MRLPRSRQRSGSYFYWFKNSKVRSSLFPILLSFVVRKGGTKWILIYTNTEICEEKNKKKKGRTKLIAHFSVTKEVRHES